MKHASVILAARILVIEDNDSDVFLLDRALKKQDFPFELVHLLNGDEALAFIGRRGSYAKAAIPNLILLDLNLARYTGEDILREIQSSPDLAGVPVCVWSSSRSRQDELLLKDLGVSRFIPKPSGLDQFMEIGKSIKDLLEAPRQADYVYNSVRRQPTDASIRKPRRGASKSGAARALVFVSSEEGNGRVWQRRSSVDRVLQLPRQ